jgi:hypothetical protein
MYFLFTPYQLIIEIRENWQKRNKSQLWKVHSQLQKFYSQKVAFFTNISFTIIIIILIPKFILDY